MQGAFFRKIIDVRSPHGQHIPLNPCQGRYRPVAGRIMDVYDIRFNFSKNVPQFRCPQQIAQLLPVIRPHTDTAVNAMQLRMFCHSAAK